MADQTGTYTRSEKRAKLIVALSQLCDLYYDDFGDGTEEGEDADALQRAFDGVDDALESLGDPDDDDDDDDDDDEAAQVDEGGFVDRR